MGKGRKVNKAKPSVSIPISARSKSSASASSAGSSPISPVTPKTPADEGIEFFQSPVAPGEAPLRVYELRLDIDGGPHKDRSYIRLPPAYVPYILRVSIDAGTPASMNGIFKTNFPLDGGKFNRARFTERKLPSDFSKPIQIDLPISHAGAFVFWVEYDGELPSQRIKGREGYFNVDPVLRIKGRSPILSSELTPLPPSSGAVLQKDTVNLPLDGLSILTVVSKWMGPMSEWKNHFAEAKDRGYTMLHYTPLQERGESDSPYSIRDQLKYDPSIFDGKRQADGGKEKVEAILKVAREEYGLLSLTDVVLNHTANDSLWLVDHPESGFSPANSPHLTPALELDSAMIEFSSSLASRGLPSIVNTQQDVDALIGAFRTVMKDLNLWQYYVLDVAREKESIRAVLASKKASPWTGPSIAGKSVVELAEVLRGSNVIIGLAELSSRFGVHSDANAASGFIQAAFVELSDPDALADAWVRVLDVINVPLYQEWEEDTKIAMDNIKNRLTYARLDEHGPKLGEITRANPLVETYFTRCGPKPDSDPLVYSLANNGWIWAADPLQNFALLPSKAYLRREVIVWGSMDEACLTSIEEIPSPTGKGPLRKAVVTPLNGSMPHALLYDLTHDNESPLHKRSAEDALSTGALVTFSYSAIGSVKGFDDLYPKLLNLVGEKRKYEVTGLEEESGIARVKRVLNSLHLEMVLGGYEEGHVHQENDYIVLSRVQPGTQKGYLLVAHTGFAKNTKDRGYISPIKLRRTRAKFIMGASIDITSYNVPADAKTLKGLPHKLVEMSPVVVPQGLDDESPYSEIIVPKYFPPGSIMLFETHLQDHDASLEEFVVSNSQEVFGNLGLVELNVVLYRADGEERDATNGQFGVYDVPGLGRLTYCGLEGWMHPLRHIMRNNDLGHPLCEHLRKGTWSLDYVYDRLIQANDLPNLKNVAQWFKDRFDRIKATAPPFLRPKYFALVISEAYKAARRSVVEQCSEFVLTGHDFTQDLALCAIQMYGLVKSASLDPSKPTPSLAAGLPHFAAGWARCWGRDVFISLRGLFLTTGNFEGARKHILAFASTLKHGLIPNLLDSVRKPRYNSRDSPWWMVQNIQDYVNMAPDGLALLSEIVPRRFPKDETWVEWDDKRAYAYSSTIAEIIQEILQRHAMGIHFKEYNAGPNLDMQMRDEGFNIDIDVDWKTGLILGGNAFNCGTWMDKMGESQKAGTKGQPGTPRDGAPVEITGLVKSALTWLDGLSSKGKFPFKGVQAIVDGKERLVTYKEWADLIQASFEQCYYVPLDAAEDTKYNLDSKLVNRRGIYKDVYGSGEGREWSDYQFRPNFPIAMTVAPELFDSKHGLHALQLADKVLRSPLGMKTLDPSDMQYRPIYDNSNDSTDAAIAKGLNYHNGPEWGWPLGFFLRAYLDFDTRVGAGKKDIKVTLHRLHQALLIPRNHLQNDPWAGIPELTNADGQYCSDSCNTQAWSASTLLDFLETVHEVNAKVAK
ncbi:glycoside hydrolase family 13 protein [Lentinula edodes]|uniref:Glycogen debranching enzyme n=1 Tax=Lentinula edodes TaxID=5353 RepID=A0A1Q3ES27_LENED|nr:glycoside hydrolase family 13 protein [Lentinula edodes]